MDDMWGNQADRSYAPIMGHLLATIPRQIGRPRSPLNRHDAKAGGKERMFDALTLKGFEVFYVAHAKAILAVDFASAVAELESALIEGDYPHRGDHREWRRRV